MGLEMGTPLERNRFFEVLLMRELGVIYAGRRPPPKMSMRGIVFPSWGIKSGITKSFIWTARSLLDPSWRTD